MNWRTWYGVSLLGLCACGQFTPSLTIPEYLTVGTHLAEVGTFSPNYSAPVVVSIYQNDHIVFVSDAGVRRRIGADGPGNFMLEFTVNIPEPGEVVAEVEYYSGFERQRISQTYEVLPKFVLTNHIARHCQWFRPLDPAETEFLCDGIVVDVAGIPIAGRDGEEISNETIWMSDLPGANGGYQAVGGSDGGLIVPVLPDNAEVTPAPGGRWEGPQWPFLFRSHEDYVWAAADWDGAVDAGTYWARIP